MSDTDIAIMKDTAVTSDHPGQTFVNAFGEGGRGDDPNDAGRELLQSREIFSQWFMVHRMPENNTFGADEETELVIQRIGADDVIVTASKNREIESQVRTALGRDLAKGEVVLFTGDGTGSLYVDLEPDGTLTISMDSGGGDTATMVMDPATGNYDVTSSGNFRVGAAGADSPFLRYNEVNTLYTTAVTGIKAAFDNHVHGYLPGPGAVTQSGGPEYTGIPGVGISFPAWDAGAASSTGRTD